MFDSLFILYLVVCGELFVTVNTAGTVRDEHVDFLKEFNGPCFDNPCKNDGVCVVNNTDYICDCKQPYSGNQCEIHPCNSNPCLNDGACISVENTYGCVCDEPFYGKHCENDPCTSNPCKNEGVCGITGIDFSCTCKHPYFGKQCDIEIDTTTAGDATPDNFTADLTTDTDEFNSTDAEDTTTAYFTNDLTTNTDEFNTTENTTADYFTNDLTTNTDECYCGDNSEICRLDWRKRKLCVCKDGFAQRRGTETCSRTCQSNAECWNDGVCDRDGPGYFCLCPEPYTGDRCDIDPCKYLRFECDSIGAKCVRHGTTGVCECPIGKQLSPSNHCEEICTFENCIYGTCEVTNSSFYECRCFDGYYGKRCEYSPNIVPVVSLLVGVLLLSGIVIFSIAAIIAGCWVKKLKKKIEDNAKQTLQP